MADEDKKSFSVNPSSGIDRNDVSAFVVDTTTAVASDAAAADDAKHRLVDSSGTTALVRNSHRVQ